MEENCFQRMGTVFDVSSCSSYTSENPIDKTLSVHILEKENQPSGHMYVLTVCELPPPQCHS